MPSDLETITQIALQGDTFDSLAYRLYGEERMSHYLREYNRGYSDVVMFDGGEELIVPLLTKTESTDTLPPWRR